MTHQRSGSADPGHRVHSLASFMLSFMAWLWLVPGTFAQTNDNESPEFEPGKTVKVPLKGVGGNEILIYIPTDYTPDREFPLIVCYHGLNGQPNFNPFKRNTGGKGFIIVGMEYLVRGLPKVTTDQRVAYIKKEVAVVRRVVAYVEKVLSIDSDARFIGGISKGGWQSGAYAEFSPDLWAGVVIIAAGRSNSNYAGLTVDLRALRGMKIYIGVGENDNNNDPAKRDTEFYRKHGAKVTFEQYAGLGHQAKPDSKILLDFLLTNGPLRHLEAAQEAARQTEQAGQLGEAHRYYQAIARMRPDYAACKQAAEKANAIATQAQQQWQQAQQQITDKNFTEAFAALAEIQRNYKGMPIAKQAEAKTKQLRSDPKMRQIIAQAKLDQSARAAVKRIDDALDEKEYDRAVRMIDVYVKNFEQATNYEKNKTRFLKIRQQQNLDAKAREQAAEGDCREWLAMAKNYIAAKRPDLARPYLKKIIAKYPDTDWSAKAQKLLKTLG